MLKPFSHFRRNNCCWGYLLHHQSLQSERHREGVWNVGCTAPPATQFLGDTNIPLQATLLEPEHHAVHMLHVCGQGAVVTQATKDMTTEYFKSLLLLQVILFLVYGEKG